MKVVSERYFDWGMDTSNSRGMMPTRGGYNLAGMETYDDLAGQPIKKWNPRVSFQVQGEEEEDFLAVAFGWPIFSSRLKFLVESAKLTGCEFHPVRVSHEDGRRMGRYWYVNILKLSGTLDMNRSQYTHIYPAGKKSLVLFKPVLLGKKIKGRDFFRLAESAASMFVSQRFVDLYRDNNCTGLVFNEVPVIW